MDSTAALHNCFQKFKLSSQNAASFLKDPEIFMDNMLGCTKSLSNLCRTCQSRSTSGTSSGLLEGLSLKNFDLEQIWQIMQLESEPLLTYVHSKSKSLKIKQFPSFKKQEHKEQSDIVVSMSTAFKKTETSTKQESANESNNFSDENEEENDVSDEDYNFNKSPDKKSDLRSKSSLDDGFFVLEDMNRFLEIEDKKEERKDKIREEDESSDEIDYFNGNLDEDAEDEKSNSVNRGVQKADKARTLMFAEFFDSPNLEGRLDSKTKDNQLSEDFNDQNLEDEVDENISDDISVPHSDASDDESENEDKENFKGSKFEMENKKMKKVIQLLEEENLAKKPWQVVGEVSAAKRPKNSLLEENLTFDQKLVAAPTITEETTETLEDIIKQRIKDEAWDDVVRKTKPVEKPFEYKRSLELNQEKSKISLAEVYEKEYIKQTEDVEEEEENPEHEKIKSMMNSLFAKLNALSNFAYTPKQPKPELKIISNVSSLQMEECTPVTTSKEQLLAPEEIHDKKKVEVKGQTEKSSTDRKHERRDKKALKKQKLKDETKRKKENIKQGNGRSESKKAALETISKISKNAKIVGSDGHIQNSLKSSAKFFDQLQESVEKGIENKKVAYKSKDGNKKKASHIKL